MKNVKFSGKEGKDFISDLRKRVNQYFTEKKISMKGNWKMKLKALLIPLIYIAPFVVILTVGMPWWFIFWLSAIMGFGLAATGMSVMHDANHGSLSEKPWINKLFGSTMYLLGGSKFNWKVQHNFLHHTYTNIEGYDEDLEAPFVLRLSPHVKLRKIHKFQHIYAFFLYSFMSMSKIVGDFFQLGGYNKKGITKTQGGTPWKEYLTMVLTKIIYFFVVIGLPIMLTDFAWWQVLLGFLVMHMVAGFIMALVFQLAHLVENVDQPLPDGNNTIENDWAIHQMRTTADFAKRNRLVSFFIGGLNYQVEHHLFPNVCHIHYPKISKIVEQAAKDHGVPYHDQPTLGFAIASHLRRMKELGREQAVGVS